MLSMLMGVGGSWKSRCSCFNCTTGSSCFTCSGSGDWAAYGVTEGALGRSRTQE